MQRGSLKNPEGTEYQHANDEGPESREDMHIHTLFTIAWFYHRESYIQTRRDEFKQGVHGLSLAKGRDRHI